MEMKENGNLVLELILFLKKWGLWEDTSNFARGNRYAHSADAGKSYMGLDHVEFTTNVTPENYTSGMTDEQDSNGNHIW